MERSVQTLKIINLILIIICIVGFVYQVYLILHQYMLGKTVVNIDVKRLKAQPLPAITVCIPALLSISKLSKWNEQNKGFHQNHMKIVEEITANKTIKEKLRKDLKIMYQNTLNKNLGKIVNLNQLFELSPTNDSIGVTIYGTTKSIINESFTLDLGSTRFVITEKTINSVEISVMDLKKCFTYFSGLQEYWNSFRFDAKLIIISITNNFTQFAPVDKYLIAIHSPNILPDISEMNYFDVKPNGDYSVKYSQLNTELLAEGFESNCADYDIKNEQGKIRMEADCLIHCYGDFMIEKFNHLTKGSSNLIRKGLISSFDKIPINLTKGHNSGEEMDICSEKCKPDCNLKRYFIEVNKNLDRPWSKEDLTLVYFQHNSMPDVVVRHTLEMTLMSFVCSFGGLLGMWLVLSFLSISKDIFQSIRHFSKLNRKKVISFNDLNINFNFINNSNHSPNQNNLAKGSN